MAKQRVIENLKFPEFHVNFEFNDIFKSQTEGNNGNNPFPFNNNYQNLRLQLSFFQSPIPNPQSPIPIYILKNYSKFIFIINLFLIKN